MLNKLRCVHWFLVVGCTVFCPVAAVAQFQEEQSSGGSQLGPAKTQRWRCGVEIQAMGGPCQGIVGYIPFPVDWPEQTVRIVEEEITKSAKVSYETVDDTVKLMVVRIPRLNNNEEAKALVTFEIKRHVLLAPTDTSRYRLPDKKKLDRRVLPYLAPGPKIESDAPRIKALAKEIPAEKEGAWEKVEAIYDWVREHVQYKEGPLKGALAALKDGTGDCEELASLFIAICRAADIPARTVWVPGHCYAEFYLVDADGKGHWFPCQAAGTRAFGEIPELRPILQKGDSFRPPWDKRDRQRYLAEKLIGSAVPGGGSPKVRFVRELLAE